MPFAAAHGLRLHYDSFGAPDAPAILLIAGLGAQSLRWSAAFCTGLAAEGFYVIRYDNRDVGLSSHCHDRPVPDFQLLGQELAAGRPATVPYHLKDMAADAIGLLDALGIARAHLVGRSMGGMIAQVATAAWPDRVLSLTSIMSGSGNPQLPPADPEVLALMRQPYPNPADDPEGFMAQALAFARRLAGSIAPFDEAATRALFLEEMQRAYDPAGVGRQLAAVVASGDRRGQLATITAPTLVIHGTEDLLVPLAHGEDTAAAIAGAEWLVIEGMGHSMPPAVEGPIIAAIIRLARRATERITQSPEDR